MYCYTIHKINKWEVRKFNAIHPTIENQLSIACFYQFLFYCLLKYNEFDERQCQKTAVFGIKLLHICMQFVIFSPRCAKYVNFLLYEYFVMIHNAYRVTIRTFFFVSMFFFLFHFIFVAFIYVLLNNFTYTHNDIFIIFNFKHVLIFDLFLFFSPFFNFLTRLRNNIL